MRKTLTALAAIATVLPGVVVAQQSAEAAAPCPARKGRIACVDLAHQRMWVMKAGKLVYGPVRIRSGRAADPTRDGHWRIFWRDRHHYSSLYNEPMPFSQFFSGGEAFHAVPDPVTTGIGSHGCINLSYRDARKLWGVLKLHDPVRIWGRRPGT